MAKENKKKSGIPRLLELAGEKKTLMVWGCILSTANVFFQLVPFLAVYNIMVELLKNASDLTNADTGFMVSWAVKGIVGLLIGYVFMYFGGMLGHTAAYRTLYGIRVRLSEHISELPLGWFNRNAIGKVKQIAEQDVEQIEKFIAHQFPDMVNTIAMLIVMVIIMFRLNVWLALACIIPIIVGFTSGIAVTIFTTQIADVFGLNFGGEKVPGDFIGKWLVYFRHFDTVNWWNTAVSIASIVIIAITPKFSKKIPGSLIAIIVVTVAVYLMKMYGGIDCIDTIGDRFSIKAELPDAVMPALNWEAIKNLFPVAITIAVLGAIESLLSATVADGVIGDKHDSNTELIAQGVANMATPLFGGIPATGAIARTMANINNGGKSPVAGIVHAVVLLLILLLWRMIRIIRS